MAVVVVVVLQEVVVVLQEVVVAVVVVPRHRLGEPHSFQSCSKHFDTGLVLLHSCLKDF